MTDFRARRVRLAVSAAVSSLFVSIAAVGAAGAETLAPQGGRVVDWQVIAGQGGRLPTRAETPAPIAVSAPAARGRAEETGLASWYGPELAGEPTASGERFDPGAMTAAHKTLPLGSIVRVTHAETGRSVVVRINDRGPFVAGRVIDLSQAAARQLGFEARGVAPVRVDFVGNDPSGRAGAILTADLAPPLATRPAPRQSVTPTAPASAARPATSRTVSVQAGEGRALFVQAASFRDPARAAAAADRLASAGRTAIQTAIVHGRTMHRVVVGPFPTGDSAKSTRARVEAAGFPGALVVERR